ncbi:MAG: tRNA dihydrouridine synthase DusB [Verrucomicrobia bacterium]|nr:tRNA dihydrouridine synthase DusB [Verrucomicrobiota bacterium]
MKISNELKNVSDSHNSQQSNIPTAYSLQPAASLPLLFLAPMAGVTNSIFRRICKERGADILTTEFLSADGIMHRNARTQQYLNFVEEERPLGVQLFGGDPERLAEAARAVVDWVKPDFIDLNFGCPVNKVVCRHGGSSLLRDCPTLEKIAQTVVKAVAPLPVTAKIRIGWDEKSINATTTARLLEGAGIQRIAVHGRTRSQGYSGRANWDVIADVVQAVRVPVIGNGDIAEAADVLQHLSTGVAGFMIGRAAMTNPWIFSEIRSLLRGDSLPFQPTLEARWELIRRHCREEIELKKNEAAAMSSMRARLMAYTKGFPGARPLREKISKVSSLGELESLLLPIVEENLQG